MALNEYVITLLSEIGIYAIAALGLNVTWGYAGQVNLGQAAFIGIGAMTSAILTLHYGAPFWLALLLSWIISMVIGLLLGLVSIRLRYDFLAISTIGFNFIVVGVFQYHDIFGGTVGITGIPRPIIFGFKLSGLSYTILVYLMFGLASILVWWIRRSWIGKAFEAINEDEIAAQSLGINVKKYKVLAFAVGTGLAGLSGSLLAHFKTSILYEDFAFSKSIEIISMSALGGMDSILGALVGSAIVKLLPEIIRPLMEIRLAFYSILIMLVLIFMPEGILGRRSVLSRQLNSMVINIIRHACKSKIRGIKLFGKDPT
jgi:branched-chain amino acid transport system permease protein